MKHLLLLPSFSSGAPTALLFIRLLTGSFLVHGVWDNMSDAARMQEFISFLIATGFAAPHFFAHLTVYVQFVIGLCLLAGLLTRWAGILLIINFTVAVVMVHLNQSFREIWPAAVLIALGTLFATLGAGRWSVDAWLERKATP
jgi:putative oxidoreductase